MCFWNMDLKAYLYKYFWMPVKLLMILQKDSLHGVVSFEFGNILF